MMEKSYGISKMKRIFSLLFLITPFLVNAQIIRDTVYSNAVSINKLGDNPNRELFIYLPKQYKENSNKSYPTVYLLHAFGTKLDSWLGKDGYENMNVSEVLDSLIEHKVISPMIVVMPDTYTHLGGSWFTNSPSAGNWMDFVANDLTLFIDKNYRTIKNKNARGIAGQSLGGYGALLVGMSHSEVFGSILSMSSPNIFNSNPFGNQAFETALQVIEFNPEAWNIFQKLMWSKAVSFSSLPDSPPFYAELPVTKSKTGEFLNYKEIWGKWDSYLLSNYTPHFISSMKQQQIMLQIGDQDPLINELKKYSAFLNNNNIDHELSVFSGDHVNGVRGQFENSVFQFFNSYFRKNIEKK